MDQFPSCQREMSEFLMNGEIEGKRKQKMRIWSLKTNLFDFEELLPLLRKVPHHPQTLN